MVNDELIFGNEIELDVYLKVTTQLTRNFNDTFPTGCLKVFFYVMEPERIGKVI